MKLEAIITCVDYSDFLARTLPLNRAQFDRLVVVTAPEDHATQSVCEYYHTSCVATDVFNSRWGKFCKGAAINVGLDYLEMDGWVVHMDGDLVLPPLFRQLVTQADLHETMIYGTDRHMIEDYDTWDQHMSSPKLQQEDNIYVHVDPYPIGTRIASPEYGGWLPIGFFQMWHPNTSGVKQYPDQHTDAGRADMLMAKNWARRDRALIPEVVPYHLESEDAPQGANWNGRTTAPFGPVPEARHRRPRHHKHPTRHHHRHPPYPSG